MILPTSTLRSRFWIGYLDAGPQSSVVVYDRLEDSPGAVEILLFHLKRNEVVVYQRATVLLKLRPLDDPYICGLRDYALSCYSPAMERFKRDKVAIRRANSEAQSARVEWREPPSIADLMRRGIDLNALETQAHTPPSPSDPERG
jgi:hypothetical protein